MLSMTPDLTALGYAMAGIAFAILTILLLTKWRGRLRSGVLFITTTMSSVWGFTLSYVAATGTSRTFFLFTIEWLFVTGWLVFLSILLSGAASRDKYWFVRYGGIVIAGTVMAIGAALQFLSQLTGRPVDLDTVLAIGSIVICLHILITIEQIHRNSRRSQKRELMCLNLGVAAIFGYTLALHTYGLFVDRVDSLFWDARGYVVAMSAMLIADSARRSPSWSVGIFVSRKVIFFVATTVIAALYVSGVIITGLLIRNFGDQWGAVLQLIFLVVAVLGFGMLLATEGPRSRLRVFISKNFFDSKHDYREHWHRLIDTLTTHSDGLGLKKRSIKAVAEIIRAPSGSLWLKDIGSGEFHCVESWNTPTTGAAVAGDDPLIVFLEESRWVIELRELANQPERYGNLTLSDDIISTAGMGFVVPLGHDEELMGFIVLADLDEPVALNFEDHDLLKTTGKQVASYLAQEQATEQLTENRQFEAYNRLTAYIMHDLKNVLAQQSLVVDNAEKHKGNPEFFDDAIATVRHGMARMRHVIEHLQQNKIDYHIENVELGELVMRAVSQAQNTDRQPSPRIDIDDNRLWVRADRDRLQMAILNAIQNAQDATPPSGSISVSLRQSGKTCAIRIKDTGCGMDQAFVRTRLFKPFDSTKGTQGMGIGMHQIREAVTAAGGSVAVESEKGRGTLIILSLPVAKR